SAEQEKLESEILSLTEQRKELAEVLVDEATRRELAELRNRLDDIDRELAALPPPQKVYAAANDFPPDGNFVPPKTPRPVHLLARGDVKKPGELMAPAAIAAVGGPDSRFEIANEADEGARPPAPARWITE